MKYLIAFVFGTILGSFLNVCIYRIPRGRSIVHPRSFCPHCRETVAWFDNIPLISFILLGGKCRHCKEKISLRYPIVEILTGLAAAFLLYYYPDPVNFAIYFIFVSALIIVTFVDFDLQEIPDEISLPGIVAGILLMTFLNPSGAHVSLKLFMNYAFGALIGFGSMFLLGFFGEMAFKKEAMGGGDMKLMAMIGAFLGWKLVLLTFFMAPVFGSAVGIFEKLKRKKEIIAYGPYLALGAVISLLYGDKVLYCLFGV